MRRQLYEGIELDYLSPSRKHFPFYKILYLSIKSKDLFTYSILIFTSQFGEIFEFAAFFYPFNVNYALQTFNRMIILSFILNF